MFVTHTLTVFERTDFYEAVGLDARQYNIDVVKNTNETAARAFPSVLDTDNPHFFPRLEACSDANEKLTKIVNSDAPQWLKFLQKMPWIAVIVWQMLLIFLQKPVDAEARRGLVY